MFESLANATNVGAAYGTMILAQAEKTGPKGEEFGKASPVGLFIILGLLFVVLVIGFGMNRRIRRMERRQAFAEENGIDLFDTEKLEKAMAEKGFDDNPTKGAMFARTEVPQTDDRFQPSSGIVTGANAIDADKKSRLDDSDQQTTETDEYNPGGTTAQH